MAHFFVYNFNFQIQPPPPANVATSVNLNLSGDPLVGMGLIFPVEIRAATALREGKFPPPGKTLRVLARVETGQAQSQLAEAVLNELELMPVGQAQNGSEIFALDVGFANTGLRPFLNCPIASAPLNFSIALLKSQPDQPANIGLILGRDAMARWHITWHGPTSTVMISD